MRRAKALASVLGGSALLLSGCGISAGKVVGKEYEASSTYTCEIGRMPIGTTGQTIPMYGSCTNPECYRLDLQDGNDDGSVCVTAFTWEHTKLGDWFPEKPAP